MATALDHLVVAGTDLSAVVAWWTATSGHQPTAGGAHPGFGTKNALVGLGEAYLELVGPDPAQSQPDQPRPFGIDGMPDNSIRLVTWALSVDDLDAAVEAMAASDVRFGPPTSMSRAKPDGMVLTWRLALPDGFDGVMPFLIEWADDGEHPSASLPDGCAVDRVVGRHPDGALLAAGLEAIDAPCTVETADHAGLSATLTTPKGTVEL